MSDIGPLSAPPFHTASGTFRSVGGTVSTEKLSVSRTLHLADLSSGMLHVSGNGTVGCSRIVSDGYVKSYNGTFTTTASIPLGNVSFSGVSDGVLSSVGGNVVTGVIALSDLSSSLQSRLTVSDASVNALNSHLLVTDASVNSVRTRSLVTDASVNLLNSHLLVTDASVNSLGSSVNSHFLTTDASVNSVGSTIADLNSHFSVTDASVNSVDSHLLVTDASVNGLSGVLTRLDILDVSVNAAAGGGGSSGGISGVDDVVQQIDASTTVDLVGYGNNWAPIYPGGPDTLRNIFCSGNGKYVIIGQDNATDPKISDDYGATWSAISGYSSAILNAAISEDGKYMLVIDSYHNVVLNTNYGNGSWTNATVGYKVTMSSTGKYQVALGTTGIQYSSDYGATWTYKSLLGVAATYPSVAMSHDGLTVYALLDKNLFKSTDAGATWSSAITITQTGSGWMPANYWYEGIACSGDGKIIVFIPALAGSGYKMVISRDSAATFSLITTPNTNFYFKQVAISACGRYMTAIVNRPTGGYNTDGVYFSDDHGTTWTQTSTAIGAVVKSGQCFSVCSNNTGSNVYVCGNVAAGGAYGVFTSKTSAGLTGVLSTCIPTNVVAGTTYFDNSTGVVNTWSSSINGGQWMTGLAASVVAQDHDPSGNPLNIGTIYFDTNNRQLKIWAMYAGHPTWLSVDMTPPV
jgi:hypothetical protein